jgi:hypothetical protein
MIRLMNRAWRDAKSDGKLTSTLARCGAMLFSIHSLVQTPRLPDASALARRIGYVLMLPRMNRPKRNRFILGSIRTRNIPPANIAFFTIVITWCGRQNIGTRFCKVTSNCGCATFAVKSVSKMASKSSVACCRAIMSTCSYPSRRNWPSAT